jgi:hypothetical protein
VKDCILTAWSPAGVSAAGVVVVAVAVWARAPVMVRADALSANAVRPKNFLTEFLFISSLVLLCSQPRPATALVSAADRACCPTVSLRHTKALFSPGMRKDSVTVRQTFFKPPTEGGRRSSSESTRKRALKKTPRI